MKKTILTLVLATITYIGWGQTVQTKNLHEFITRGFTTVNIYKIEHQIMEDRSYKVWNMTYQNAEYQHISDKASITLFNEDEVIQFATDIEFMITQGNNDVVTLRDNYSIKNSGNSIFIFDEDKKYTYVSKSKAKKLINDIKSHSYLMND